MFRIRLAGMTVEIDNRHNYVYELCRDYLCFDSAPAFRVAVSTAETQAYQAACGRPMTLPEAESHLLYRRICERMPRYGVFLLHAAVVELDGRGYAFSARRGVGKSTHTELWQTRFQGHAGERYKATVINGDKPLVRRTPDGRFWAFGTPWCGKEGLSTNTSVPLTDLCFIKRSASNETRPLDRGEALSLLLEQVVIPSGSGNIILVLDMLDRLLSSCRLWEIGCNTDITAAEHSSSIILR